MYLPVMLTTNLKLSHKFVSQKIEPAHYYSCPQAKLSHKFLSLPPPPPPPPPPPLTLTPLRQKEITHSFLTAFSEDLFFNQQKR